MFLWHFNGDSYWTREEPGAAKCVAVMPQKPGVRKHQRVEKKAIWSLPLTSSASFMSSICFAAPSYNTKRWISSAGVWLICFLLPAFPLSLFHLFFPLFLLFAASRWWFSAKRRSCHIPLLNLTHDTCLLGRMRCVMKASFLRENWLSTGTSFPSLELITVAFPHHTCL